MNAQIDEIDEYVQDILRALPASQSGREEFANDIAAHLRSRVESGVSAGDAIARMGDAQAVAAGFLESAPLKYATPWQRAGALLIDMMIPVDLIVSVPIAIMMMNNGTPGVNPILEMVGWVFFLVFFVSAMLSVFYFPVCEAKKGATLGKHAFGLSVRRDDGTRIGWKEAWIRRIPLFFQFFWIDGLLVFFTKKRQRAFDMVAGTIVIETGNRAELSRRGRLATIAVVTYPIVALGLATIWGLLTHRGP